MAPKTAKGAKWTLKSWLFNSSGSRQRKLLVGGMLMWSAVRSFRADVFDDALLLALLALFIILNPVGIKWWVAPGGGMPADACVHACMHGTVDGVGSC